MSRILLSTIGSLGDLHPLIAIGLELRRRGHAVRFCTSETYRPKIESMAFGFDSLRPDATPENEAVAHLVKEIMDPNKGAERLLRGILLPELRATYADLLRAVTGPPAIDVLVYGELVYPAPIIAEKFGLRSATCIMAPMSFFSAHDPPVLPPVPRLSAVLRRLGPAANAAAIGLIKRFTHGWSEPIRALRAELKLPPGRDPIYEGKFSPQLVLGLFSPVLAEPQPDWPPNTVVTGYTFYDGADAQYPTPAELAQFLEGGEPPLVFTLGSSAVLHPGQFYSESAEATRQLNRRAVLLVGKNPAPTPLPEGVIALRYVRFSELFPQAAAVVHQGGIGTTGQVMRAGCPMLVMPYNFDQPDNAARIARLGIGQVISRRAYCGAKAASKLRALLEEPKHQNAAAKIGAVVQQETGSRIAADAIERLLR